MKKHPSVILRNWLRYAKQTGDTPEPVTLDEVKNYLKLEYGFLEPEDTELQQMITAARHLLERTWSVGMTPRTVDVEFQHSGCDWLRLPYGPVQEVTEVLYSGCGCVGQPFVSDTDYCVNGDYFKGKEGYYRVTYTSGHTVCPDEYKNAIKKQVAWMYENRGDEKKQAMNPDLNNAALTQNSWI